MRRRSIEDGGLSRLQVLRDIGRQRKQAIEGAMGNTITKIAKTSLNAKSLIKTINKHLIALINHYIGFRT